MSVVGARPQFVKLAPICDAVDKRSDIEHIIVHTGQHYDPSLSDVFFRDLQIPAPNRHLDVGSGSHGLQTGRILAAMDPVLEEERPDWVLVYGDTNSTLAAALSAVKLHVPLAHLEAGLRSFNRRMPEEHNRVLVDHAADLLLAPTMAAMEHLRDEGLGDRSTLVGDVMTDVCFRTRGRVLDSRSDHQLPSGQSLPLDNGKPYLIATIHRADNTDDAIRLGRIIDALKKVDVTVLLLVHPRLRTKADSAGIELAGGSIRAMPPLSYPDMVCAVLGATGVVTDSGGLQKEAFLLGVPCTTLRSETEWPETLIDGWNILDPDVIDLPTLAARPAPATERPQYYGDGSAAERAIDAIARRSTVPPRA